MRTAEEMFDYVKDNKLGSSGKKTLKDFKVVESSLGNNEDVLFCFVGILNYISITKNDGVFAFAITKDRIIIGRKEFLFGEKLKTLELNDITEVTLETQTGSGMLDNGVITINTISDTINIMTNKKIANTILREINSIRSN